MSGKPLLISIIRYGTETFFGWSHTSSQMLTRALFLTDLKTIGNVSESWSRSTTGSLKKTCNSWTRGVPVAALANACWMTNRNARYFRVLQRAHRVQRRPNVLTISAVVVVRSGSLTVGNRLASRNCRTRSLQLFKRVERTYLKDSFSWSRACCTYAQLITIDKKPSKIL